MIDEEFSRRCKFRNWLLQAWEWSVDNYKPDTAANIAELLRHIDEEDYPAWEKARQCGVIGDTALADRMRNVLGLPLQQPERTGWEKDIRYSPIIYLEEDQWHHIHRALGWANRDSDSNINALNFFLWSPQGNPVRFVLRKKEALSEQRATEEDS